MSKKYVFAVVIFILTLAGAACFIVNEANNKGGKGTGSEITPPVPLEISIQIPGNQDVVEFGKRIRSAGRSNRLIVNYPSPDQNGGKHIDLQTWKITPNIWESMLTFTGKQIQLGTLFYVFDEADMTALGATSQHIIEMPPSFFFKNPSTKTMYLRLVQEGKILETGTGSVISEP